MEFDKLDQFPLNFLLSLKWRLFEMWSKHEKFLSVSLWSRMAFLSPSEESAKQESARGLLRKFPDCSLISRIGADEGMIRGRNSNLWLSDLAASCPSPVRSHLLDYSDVPDISTISATLYNILDWLFKQTNMVICQWTKLSPAVTRGLIKQPQLVKKASKMVQKLYKEGYLCYKSENLSASNQCDFGKAHWGYIWNVQWRKVSCLFILPAGQINGREIQAELRYKYK